MESFGEIGDRTQLLYFISLDLESKTLLGATSELMLDKSGQFFLDNTTLDYQRFSDKEILRMTGPLGADFTVKVRSQSSGHSLLKRVGCFHS